MFGHMAFTAQLAARPTPGGREVVNMPSVTLLRLSLPLAVRSCWLRLTLQADLCQIATTTTVACPTHPSTCAILLPPCRFPTNLSSAFSTPCCREAKTGGCGRKRLFQATTPNCLPSPSCCSSLSHLPSSSVFINLSVIDNGKLSARQL